MPPGIDEPQVAAWLTANIDGLRAPFTYAPIGDGRSNLTYGVTDSTGRRVVLRRPPLGQLLATAHDMTREYTLISSLAPTGVPLPDALGLCTDEAVNGPPFYVMSYVDGVVLNSAVVAAALSPEARLRAGRDLVDVLAALHGVDVDTVGLDTFAKRSGYVERQLKRWSAQWEASKTRELAEVEEVARLLAADIPEPQGVDVTHGDYRFGNCMFDADSGELRAVLDWELCTLGDGMADLGYLGLQWSRDQHQPGATGVDPTSAGGFPTWSEVLARYEAGTGRDVTRVRYYIALAAWRLAVITEGVYARYLNHQMGSDLSDDELGVYSQTVTELAARALTEITTSPPGPAT